jgi:hypothetical protein
MLIKLVFLLCFLDPALYEGGQEEALEGRVLGVQNFAGLCCCG